MYSCLRLFIYTFLYTCIALYANEGGVFYPGFTSDIAIELRVAVLKL